MCIQIQFFIQMVGVTMMVPDSVNGHELQEGQPMPWMALITQGPNYHNHFRCGGSLVNNQFVLTAAHCFCGDALMCDTPLSTCSHLQPNETHPSIKLRVRETVFGFGCASIPLPLSSRYSYSFFRNTLLLNTFLSSLEWHIHNFRKLVLTTWKLNMLGLRCECRRSSSTLFFAPER